MILNYKKSSSKRITGVHLEWKMFRLSLIIEK